MQNIFHIVRFEYRKHITKKSFIWTLVSMPLMLILMVGLIWLTISLENDNRPVGYIDPVGVFTDPLMLIPESRFDEPVEMISFSDESAAADALEAEEIQSYYLIADDYYETLEVTLVYIDEPGDNARRDFWDFIQLNLLSDQSEPVARRISSGHALIVRSTDGSREMGEEDILSFLVPYFAGLVFVIMILFSSGYLMSAVVEEKENRTMEVMITTISSIQMIAGKVFAVLAVISTVMGCWLAFALGAMLIIEFGVKVPVFSRLTLDIETLLLSLLVLLPSYIFFAALMTAIGATATAVQEAQQFNGLFILPTMAPYWLSVPIFENPNGPLAIVLTLIPMTAPSTFTARISLAPVPTWQIALSAIIQSICAAGAVWLAAKAFRMGMLRYGKRLRFSEIFRKIGKNA